MLTYEYDKPEHWHQHEGENINGFQVKKYLGRPAHGGHGLYFVECEHCGRQFAAVFPNLIFREPKCPHDDIAVEVKT